MPYEWVSVHEASRRLNRSVSTIRRQIESGELVGEREPLARGSTRDRYRVRLDVPSVDQETHHDASPPSEPATRETPHEAPAALMIAMETIRDQSARIAELEREAGRLEGQVIAANAERAAVRQAAETAAEHAAEALKQTQAQLDQARREADDLRDENDRLMRRSWWGRLWNR